MSDLKEKSNKKKPPHLSHDGGLKPHEVVDQKVESLQERNARVEGDKAWETSWIRRLFIAVVTYCIATYYMSSVGLGNAFVGAFVPTGGYLLSTMSLPFVKNFWLRTIYKKREL